MYELRPVRGVAFSRMHLPGSSHDDLLGEVSASVREGSAGPLNQPKFYHVVVQERKTFLDNMSNLQRFQTVSY